jgi:hypothetical protein
MSWCWRRTAHRRFHRRATTKRQRTNKKDADKKDDDKDSGKKDADKKDSDKKGDSGQGQRQEGCRQDSGKKDADKKDDDKPVEVKVDLEKIGDRILALPIPARNYGGIANGKAGVVYLAEGLVGRAADAGGWSRDSRGLAVHAGEAQDRERAGRTGCVRGFGGRVEGAVWAAWGMDDCRGGRFEAGRFQSGQGAEPGRHGNGGGSARGVAPDLPRDLAD